MLDHIALPVNEDEDIDLFYVNILGFEKAYHFVVGPPDSIKLFDEYKPITVQVMQRDALKLELFQLSLNQPHKGYQHICLRVNDLENTIQRLLDAAYLVTIADRITHKVAFTSDSCGNRFELKQNEL